MSETNDLFADQTMPERAPATGALESFDGLAESVDEGETAPEACELAIQLNSIWVTQDNGEQLHLKHFQPQFEAEQLQNYPGSQRRVFMLHGEAESGRVYYDSRERGLAWHLARQGYEVFVADLGGRGRSLVSGEGSSTLSVQDIITSSIPRFVQAIANTPSYRLDEVYYGCPADIWVGHGFGCVMLSAAWARLPSQLRLAQQMIFFSGRRQMAGKQKLSSLFISALNHPLMRRWVERLDRFPAAKLGLGPANENVAWYLAYLNWLTSKQWLGEDAFDYRAALASAPLPPVLHLSAQSDLVYSNLCDIRAFIEELGPHDARLMLFGRSECDQKQYNHLSMLLGKSAETEVFAALSAWLNTEAGGAWPAADWSCAGDDLQTSGISADENNRLHPVGEQQIAFA